MFYQYNSIFKKTYLSSDPETTLDWSQEFDLSETISGIIFFLATEFDLGLSLKLKNGLSLRFAGLRNLISVRPSQASFFFLQPNLISVSVSSSKMVSVSGF